MTGTPSRPAFAIWYNAGISFLRTRSPVAPNNTTASARLSTLSSRWSHPHAEGPTASHYKRVSQGAW